MEKPTWVTIVSVLGIIFSCLAMLGGMQEIMAPKMMEFQQDMFTQMEKMMRQEIEKEQARQGNNEPLPEFPFGIFTFMKDMWNVPEWYTMWSISSGLVRLLVHGLFLFVAIQLLQTKASSIPLFYWVAGSNIFFNIIRGIVSLSMLSSFVGTMMMGSGIFGIVVDTVLIIVVATGNKEVFKRKLPPPLPQDAYG